ncbi:iron-containing redox enzyme family protein [Parafrankia discariae]|uniref:iron-containing redox enzyme family protein n=1 Tax=Parafrankia discariae TaxID=365528 RepID=UPI00037431FB|nr:iron-containing redox enzyme family protein [Parafrankia discariae]
MRTGWPPDHTAGYGTVFAPAVLEAPPLPVPRGPLSAYLVELLGGGVRPATGWPEPADDALFGEDGALALYCLYELHYRGFHGVDDRFEWEPSLLALRAELEGDLERRLVDLAGPDLRRAGDSAAGDATAEDIAAGLRQVISQPGGRSLSGRLVERGSLEQFREYATHRSLLQLKEADPHTWAVPRLTGAAKAALVEIQADEYGGGTERDMHQNLFGLTMLDLGLDPSYGAHVDRLPGHTLATANVPSFFGLHRRWRGALVGHLAVFEMTSVEPMGAYAAALRRLGLPWSARHFFEVHVVADAHHQSLAAESLAGGLVRAEPALAGDVLFGARATMAVEGHCAENILTAWDRGGTALLPIPGEAVAR